MTELEILRELAARTQLLEPRADADEQRARVAEFTRRAAWELRALGWGNLLKIAGNQVNGLSVDKLIHKHTGDVADVVVDSDGPAPEPAWNIVDTLDPAALFEYPRPEPGTVITLPTPAPPPAPVDEMRLEDFLARIVESGDRIYDGLAGVAEALRDNTRELKAVREGGIKWSL